MKQFLKRGLEITIFAIILISIVLKLSLLVNTFGKELDNDRYTRLFFEIPKNTVDVLFAGDSHVYNSFIPQMLFDKKGYTSAMVATSNQSIINTYWLIEEALINQDPQIIIIDIHSLEDTYRKKNNYLHFTSGILSIPDESVNKYLCLKDIKKANYGISDSINPEDVIAFLQFRNDYERSNISLRQFANLIFNPSKEYKTFGYYPASSIFDIEGELIEGTYEKEEIEFENSITFKYLNKITELCNRNRIRIIITRNLYSSNSTNMNTINEIKEFASIHNIDYIDYFELIDECSFEKRTDFYNGTHLNYSGAKKATNYLIDYLEKNYSLSNHKGDKKYSLWEENDYDYGRLEKEMNKAIHE